jgi:splicing factor 3A subunit 1
MAVEIQTMPGLNGHTSGDVDMDVDTAVKDGVLRFTSGVILPPPEIKCKPCIVTICTKGGAHSIASFTAVIDRTALFVARSANPPQFEDKIRENQRSDPKFSFLNPADPYHAYYRQRMDKIAQGDLEDDATPEKGGEPDEGEGIAEAMAAVDIGQEPPAPEFIMDLPNISSIDLDIMKLTALFTARRGRSFLASLSAREGRNYQFDFLRPTHSLFGYFNRLVEQYSKVINPSKDALESLTKRTGEVARWETLEIARKHAKWERNKREKDKKRLDDQETEKIAFAEIDWNDYAIVQTIEFTAADANSELPPPMSVQEVENMTLAQKRMAAMIMEDTSGDVEALRAQQAAAEAEAAAAVGGAGIADDDGAAMEESDDEDEGAQARRKREAEEREREIERARAIQASSVNAAGPMKIRTDYVPKLGAKKGATMTTCTICGQQIPVDELDEHMRIELLDPRWKSQRDILEARKAQSSELQRGANVVSSLKNLARSRVDIFGGEVDEERRKRQEEEEREKRKEREKVVWDGHTASKENTLNKFQTNVNFDEQIAAIHRAKGLGPQEVGAIGPGIGPAAAPAPMTGLPPPPASLPAPPQASGSGSYSAATISSGPQPASIYPGQPAPVMLPPLHYQGMDAAQPFGYQPAPPGSTSSPAGMHPSRIAALAAGGPIGTLPLAGTIRSADEMEADGMPPAKRQKVAKLPGGQCYPEADWINMHPHPISLQVQLPDDPSKPEWKLDGSIVTIPDLPLNLLVSTLRDRILQHTRSSLPTSRMRLSYTGKMLTNAYSIASFNLEDEDLLVLSVSSAKKK